MIMTRGKNPDFPKDFRSNKGEIVKCRVCRTEFKIRKSQQLIFCSDYCREKFITLKYYNGEKQNGKARS